MFRVAGARYFPAWQPFSVDPRQLLSLDFDTSWSTGDGRHGARAVRDPRSCALALPVVVASRA